MLNNPTSLMDAGGMGIPACQQLEAMGMPNLKRVNWGKPCFRKRNSERFVNLRARAMVHCARAAKEGRLGIVDGPWRKDVLDQGSRIPYHFDEKARYQIAKKEDMRRDGIPSPDIWDAISFLFLEDADYIIAESVAADRQGASGIDAVRKAAQDAFADA